MILLLVGLTGWILSLLILWFILDRSLQREPFTGDLAGDTGTYHKKKKAGQAVDVKNEPFHLMIHINQRTTKGNNMHNNKTLIAVFTLWVVSMTPVMGQHHHMGQVQDATLVDTQETMNMADGNMQHMQMMMQDPIHRSSMLVWMLPTMQEQLGLSDEQNEALEGIKQEYKLQQAEAIEQLSHSRNQLEEQLTLDGPNLEEVKYLLRDIGVSEADMQVLGIASVHRMKKELTDTQRTILVGMNPSDMHLHMSGNMSMNEMMQASQSSMMMCSMMQGMQQNQTIQREGMKIRKMQPRQ